MTLARKVGHEDYAVGLLARPADYLSMLTEELHRSGVRALAVPTDLTNTEAVAKAFVHFATSSSRSPC